MAASLRSESDPQTTPCGHQTEFKAAKDEDWLIVLDRLLLRRDISAGIALLDETESEWEMLESPLRSKAELLLILAQWVDVGYRDMWFLRKMLDLMPPQARLELSVRSYVRLEMAEAFYALAIDDVDTAIAILDTVLKLNPELLTVELTTLAHLWKGRSHRNKADYDKALEHIELARDLAVTLAGSEARIAIIQIQQGWLLFQRGDNARALQVFQEAETVLQQTDHWIALGNIESARGRIVRRQGDYEQALRHFSQAVALYEKRSAHHPNLARAVTNLAFVKRLLALQLRKHIDSVASQRTQLGLSKSTDGQRLRPLHKQHRELYQSAILELERAKHICMLHGHASGLAAALLNAAYLHLDVGDVDSAAREAAEAYEIAERTNIVVLKARARILSGRIENARLEDLHGRPDDAPTYARRAKQHCVEALSLTQGTENKRLLLSANIALGEVSANSFFQDFTTARRCVDAAATLITSEDADYIVDELNALKAKLVQTVGLDDTIRAWSQGMVNGKSLQEVMEGFAEVVVTQLWLRENRRVLRVAKLLSTSPKKVRRLIKHSGHIDSGRGRSVPS